MPSNKPLKLSVWYWNFIRYFKSINTDILYKIYLITSAMLASVSTDYLFFLNCSYQPSAPNQCQIATVAGAAVSTCHFSANDINKMLPWPKKYTHWAWQHHINANTEKHVIAKNLAVSALAELAPF